jgi:flagellar biosynthesis/type III secretory pathway chaperone
MTPHFIAAAVQLADMLERENRALAQHDFSRAASLLSAKTSAMDAFHLARSVAAAPAALDEKGPDASDADRHAADQIAERLRILSQDNKRLLERAIAVQGRIIGLIVEAIPRQAAQAAGRYDARGDAAATRTTAMTLSARA